jgi:opacity protein-like surface antigen
MKKTHLAASILSLAALLANPIKSNAQAFAEGANYVNVGYGFGTFLGNLSNTFDEYTDVKYTGLGPIYAKYERGITDRIGLGFNFAYATNEWDYNFGYTDENGNARSYTESTKRSTWSALARFNFHFGSSDKFDPYIGVGLGYRSANWKYETTDPNGGSGVELKTLMPFGSELTLGARYLFNDNFGLYAEVGAAKSVGQLGLTYKF